jgi:hypothetical protein
LANELAVLHGLRGYHRKCCTALGSRAITIYSNRAEAESLRLTAIKKHPTVSAFPEAPAKNFENLDSLIFRPQRNCSKFQNLKSPPF